jgi:hypothetical protein
MRGRLTPGQNAQAKGDEGSSDPAQYAPTPRQGEDRETDIFPEQQQRRLLPRQGPKLDFVLLLLDGESRERVELDFAVVLDLLRAGFLGIEDDLLR